MGELIAWLVFKIWELIMQVPMKVEVSSKMKEEAGERQE